jgi:cytochrome P450
MASFRWSESQFAYQLATVVALLFVSSALYLPTSSKIHYNSILQVYLVAKAVYNKFISPLCKIPGSSLNAVSWLPWYKYWFSGYMHREVLRLHEKYGPVVRIGPSEVSFIDKTAWKDIYSLKRCRQIERDPQSFPSLTPNGSKFDLLTYSPSDHARYRRILNPCFAEKATKTYEPTIRENVDKMVAKLSTIVEKVNASIDVTKWFQWLTFDMVTDVCWGESFECVDEEKSHPCLALSMDLVSFSSFIVFVAWWKGLKDLLVKLSGVEGLFVNLVRSKCENNIKLSDASKKASIYSNLRAAGNPLNQAELDGNLTALIIAGSETTGFALTATSYYLAKHPDCFRRAAAEVRSAFSSADDINDDALKKLSYLKATIDEALRMTPAEPNGLARKVVANDGLDIAGQFIPKNVSSSRALSPNNAVFTDYARPQSTSPNLLPTVPLLISTFPTSTIPSAGLEILHSRMTT